MNNTTGFSLVELMVAVGIVGVMSSVAVPKYQKYKVNATRAEAQSSLSSMYTLQQLYYTEKDQYGKVTPDTSDLSKFTDNDIQFPGNADYKYKYTAVPSGTDLTEFHGTAESKQVLGSCAKGGKVDKWCINHNKVLSNRKIAGNTPPGVVESPCTDNMVQFAGC